MSSWTQTTSPQQKTTLRQIESEFFRRLKPPERLLPSEWAEKYRVLKSGKSREPGPWRNKRAPHLVGIMDVCNEPGVVGAVVVKGARVGYSEAWKNMLGCWIDCEPDPTMFVLPDKASADKIMQGDIRPLLVETPRLSQYVSDERSDNKLELVRLDSMDITTGWAGSAQSLASSNQRRVLFDETDKFNQYSGRESDPISLGMARANTYAAIGRAFYLLGSTPTTAVGHIAQRADNCTQHRRWHAPCPHCGTEQQIVWDQVKWSPRREDEDRRDHAARIGETGDAWYECKHCEKKITEDQKPRMMNKGRWVADDPNSSNRWVAFYAPSYISLMMTWAQIAESWIRAQGDPPLLMEVINQYLGETFEEQASSTKPDLYQDKAKHGGQPLVCPKWTQAVLMSADVQKDHLYYVIRAWGAGARSQLVRYGMASSFEELRQLAFGGQIAGEGGVAMTCDYIAVDARYRTDEVYAFAASDPARVKPVMGSDKLRMPLTQQKVKAYHEVIQYSVNPNYWKDVLHGLICDDDITRWLPHNSIGGDYCKQMSSEHKVHDPKAGNYVWQVISKGADNHLWDCEVMNTMLANECGLFVMEADETPPTSGGFNSDETDGDWLDRHRGRWT